MAEENYAVRIAAAEGQLAAAENAREQCYPGTPEWTYQEGKVAEWQSVLAQLHREAAS